MANINPHPKYTPSKMRNAAAIMTPGSLTDAILARWVSEHEALLRSMQRSPMESTNSKPNKPLILQ